MYFVLLGGFLFGVDSRGGVGEGIPVLVVLSCRYVRGSVVGGRRRAKVISGVGHRACSANVGDMSVVSSIRGEFVFVPLGAGLGFGCVCGSAPLFCSSGLVGAGFGSCGVRKVVDARCGGKFGNGVATSVVVDGCGGRLSGGGLYGVGCLTLLSCGASGLCTTFSIEFESCEVGRDPDRGVCLSFRFECGVSSGLSLCYVKGSILGLGKQVRRRIMVGSCFAGAHLMRCVPNCVVYNVALGCWMVVLGAYDCRGFSAFVDCGICDVIVVTNWHAEG